MFIFFNTTDILFIFCELCIVYDNNNKPSLSELELIEPELWFRNCKESTKKLAEEIEKYFN